MQSVGLKKGLCEMIRDFFLVSLVILLKDSSILKTVD